MTPVLLGPSDCLVLLEIAGILKTRFAQTVQNPLSAISVVLSKFQWENILNSSPKVVTEAGFLGSEYLRPVQW